MALIMHRCTKCGHPDFWRGETDRNGDRAPCACGHKCTPTQTGPAEVVPTFNETGAQVERIATPGERIDEDLPTGEKRRTPIVPCGCTDCKALHAQLTTV